MGENGLLKQLTKAILERALQAELTDHLSPHRSAALHRASGAGFAKLCALEAPQIGGGRCAPDLSCGHRGRSLVRPYEVAMLALFLCSNEASFITGVDYPIDGGFLNLHD